MKNYFYYIFADICPMNIKECDKQDRVMKRTFNALVIINMVIWFIALV